MTSDSTDTDVVVFVDALTPRELQGFLSDHHQGNMDADVPRVTPRVMSSIYTGLNPADNGMMDISRFEGDDATRPKKSTFIDQAVREGMCVLCMGMPFCIPFREVNEGSMLQGDALGGQSQVVPEGLESILNVPGPSTDMMSDHPDTTYSSFLDQLRNQFTRFKENLRQRDFDTAFLGVRLVDSYCHFQHMEERDGKPYRQHLIDNLQRLMSEVDAQVDGDVMFFSDHGQTELETTFRINRWLAENGYLEFEVDYSFIDDLQHYETGETHPVDESVENQVILGQPGVKLDAENSEVVCDDPFDSCLTLLVDREDFDEEGFREDLMETGHFRSVDYKWELYDENSDHYGTVPDIMPDRGEGVFVSGNLHRSPIGMGYYRTGVHDRTACFGATKKLNIPEKEKLKPEDMYDVIRDFIGLELSQPPLGDEEIESLTYEEKALLRRELGVEQ